MRSFLFKDIRNFLQVFGIFNTTSFYSDKGSLPVFYFIPL